MKTLRFALLILILALPLITMKAQADQENFDLVLAKIGGTHWQGNFKVLAGLAPIGLPIVTCSGPLTVLFFQGNDTDIPGEVPTVSYRHNANFNQNLNPICETIGKSLSVVDVGACKDFPMKWSPDENQLVPFRTLIPRDGGNSAVVSSPSCDKGVVKRQELELRRAELSPDGQKLLVTIELKSTLLNAELTYDLYRAD